MDTTAQWQHHEGAGFMKGNINMGAEIMGSNMNNIACTTNKPGEVEKKARPQEQLNCPRCNSTNTKFCYYNNYSLTQPRYFCKTCRRYWTEGGTLRNVPVGGGSRKNKKPSSTSTSSCSSSMLSKNSNSNIPDLNPPLTNLSNISHQAGQDLNLAFPDYSKFQYLMPTKIENDNSHHQNPRFATSSPLMSFIASNPGGGPAGGHFEAPGSNTAATFSSGFQFQEFKPSTVGFRAQDNINGGNIGGRISLFPNEVDHHHQQQHKGQGSNPTGYWSGLLGGGSW